MTFRFISLGGDCQPAVQINSLNPTRTRSFFDVVSIPIAQTIALIENDFQDLMLTENLRPVYVEDTLERVVDTRWDLHFVHDFPSLEPEAVEAVRAQYLVRARWFMDLFDDEEAPPYFVRRWFNGDGPEDEREAIRLFELLRSRRRDVRLLYLHNDPFRPERVFGAYRSAYLLPPDNAHWVGNTGAWRTMLRDFALRPHEETGFALPAGKQRPRFAVRSA